jgi:hypothetical protein
MKRSFQIALVWLLTVALPAQAFAAAALLGGPAHHAAATAENHPAHHAGHDADHAAHHPAASEPAHHGAEAPADMLDHESSSCASCPPCAGVSIVAALPDLSGAPFIRTQLIPLDSGRFFGRTPDGLERPPRNTLA